MKHFLCNIFFVILFIVIGAQFGYSQIYVKEESSISNMMNRFEQLNEENPLITAWRIQIIATNDRRKMEQTISKFRRLYPHLDYEWKHASPYYQVYIGAFEQKEDFQAFLIDLKKDFPSSIPVIERMPKEKLL